MTVRLTTLVRMLLLAAALLAIAAALHAQPPAAPGAAAVPVFGSGVDVVVLDADDPFRLGDVRMAPDLSDGLHAAAGSEDALALYSVVYPRPGAAEPPRMTLEIARDGRVIRRGSIPLPAAGASGRIAHVSKVPVAALAPGDYTLRLSVSQNGSTASEEAPLRVASSR